MARESWASLAVVLLAATPARAAGADAAGSPALPPLLEDPATGIELVLVEGGCFQMGDSHGDGKVISTGGEPAEEPVHEVCVDDFYMGKHEVTRGQWKSITGTASNVEGGRLCVADDCPVGNVSWSDVQEFVAALNRQSGGSKYRLPTEAEWEYAARSGGRDERYSGGNDVDSVSWHAENSGFRIDPGAPIVHPVGTKAPNGLGLHDMSGNVWELTSDWYESAYYASSPRDNPTGPASGEERVKRGGCAHGLAANSRVFRRGQFSGALPLNGFRVVKIP
jgi:formylglycine-generating enzyme required for sulfatase activity